MARWRIFSLAIALSALLVGCGDNPAEQQWQAYHQQLADDLAQPGIERADPVNIGDFPERSERLIDIPETRDSLLNVYALRECQITSLVAARNNQLGRVAPPSQQWLYERTLWQRLSACLNSQVPDQLSDEDRTRLEQLTATKTAQLPAVSWNAIFDSSEWVKSFARASQPLSNVDEVALTSQLDAIEYLQQMTDHQFDLDWQQDSATLENHLKTLQERPLTAEVLRTLLLASQRLTEANALLTQHSDATHCLRGWETPSVEPLASTAKQWLTAINRLIDAQQVDKPLAIQRYQTRWLSLNNAQAPWGQFQRALTEHQTLRARFAPCSNN
ncbi:MAG: DUF3080 family protein [Gammaproteobacteria bacterium]|uniref:DUF3080 domain-containing protein n=1 Tax=Vreelandella titanicae TaxID=664683 RepID=A0A558J4E4_9GAMM|nr:DUF3080 family protein [Halomonas titanicae]MBR9905868.1 DUF3080 family protein [Gammaproteobacteria bacterium]TVU88518.1 DUF3080 domain-containing protein [Halomonas titanicae]